MKRGYSARRNSGYESARKRRRFVSNYNNSVYGSDDEFEGNPLEKLGELLGGNKKKEENKNVYAEDNHIYFRTDVNSESIDELIKLIREQNRELVELKKHPTIKSIEARPIYLHITSYGGCLYSGFRAVDAIKRSKIPIYTVVDGPSASAGALMSVVGEKRFMTPSSWMLIHQLSTGNGGGTFGEIKDEFENCELMMEHIYKILQEHTGMTKRELVEQLSHDSWWGIDKCMEVGLIDAVYAGDY